MASPKDQTDWARYNFGRDELLTRFRALSLYGYDAMSEYCRREASCKSAVKTFRALFQSQQTITLARQPDIIDRALTLQDRIGNAGFCASCEGVVERTVNEFLHDTWNELSDIFRLQDSN